MLIQAGRGKPRTRVRDYRCGGQPTKMDGWPKKRTTNRSRRPTEADNPPKRTTDQRSTWYKRSAQTTKERQPLDKSPILAALSLLTSSLQSRPPPQGAVRSSHSHYNFSQDLHKPSQSQHPFSSYPEKVIADTVRWDSQKKKNG